MRPDGPDHARSTRSRMARFGDAALDGCRLPCRSCTTVMVRDATPVVSVTADGMRRRGGSFRPGLRSCPTIALGDVAARGLAQHARALRDGVAQDVGYGKYLGDAPGNLAAERERRVEIACEIQFV